MLFAACEMARDICELFAALTCACVGPWAAVGTTPSELPILAAAARAAALSRATLGSSGCGGGEYAAGAGAGAGWTGAACPIAAAGAPPPNAAAPAACPIAAALATCSAAAACSAVVDAAAAAAPDRPTLWKIGSPSSSKRPSSSESDSSSACTSRPAASAAAFFARFSASCSSLENLNPDPPNPLLLPPTTNPSFFFSAYSSAIVLRSPGTGCFASVIALTRSGANFSSSCEMNVTAVPLLPARPVRPTLCT
mmetsp:Transcript_4212/g.17321  ORF Transcript_4212/g.17321 Transcript_4212/m.17321 type:complete len:253 (+) Transcript_4212:2395-3153(+)